MSRRRSGNKSGKRGQGRGQSSADGRSSSGRGRGNSSRRGPRHHGGPRNPSQTPRSRKQAGMSAAQTEEAAEATIKRIDQWLEEGAQQAKPSGEFKLDPWQREAYEGLEDGLSVVVDAPTTAGKTRVVEAYFREHLDRPNFRACYTTPVKSLSNDKLREFRQMFGHDKVGIATGDIKENLGAPVVVATLESYRNSLLGMEPDLGRNLVVFDEYHYIQDAGRGSAWEEAIILTPPACQILMLSASIANAEDFRDWVSNLHQDRPTKLVQTLERPVPLTDLVYIRGHWLDPELVPPAALKPIDRDLMRMPLRAEALAERLAVLPELKLTPTIVYCGRRVACEHMARMLSRALKPLAEEQRELIGELLQTADQECGALKFIDQNLRGMLQTYGVGFHHSGMAAPARIAVETLVKAGSLRFCTATMGLSLGINFAVRSAVIADYKRPGEGGWVNYSESETLQMLGRAGRRGQDVVGFSLFPSAEAYAKQGKPKREPASSRLRNDPTTFLGLVSRGFSLRAIEQFYNRSFMRFHDSGIDLSLMTMERWRKKFPGLQAPCDSPAAAAGRFQSQQESPQNEQTSACFPCDHRRDCHDWLHAKSASGLAALHLHLHRIDALTTSEGLSDYGKVARYFPQNGGLLFARWIVDGRLNSGNLITACELAACLALARFKEPGAPGRYKPPFGIEELEEELETFYPYDLFEEIYDQPFGRRNYPVIRDFNPDAGYIMRQWLTGSTWQELTREVCHEAYGVGDVMSLMFRVATYLQSIIQTGDPELKPAAQALRPELLREPLEFALTIAP